MVIDNKNYEFKRLRRFEEIAGALLINNTSTFKHFTFLTRGTKILSIGWNDITKNSKLVEYPLGGIHSEAMAIGNLADLNDCRRATLINIRLNNHRVLRNAKPCDVCFGLLYRMGFKRLYYSTNDGFSYIHL